MALVEYARLPLFLDGTHITQLTSVEAEWDSGQQRVDLLHEGLGGFTPGSGSVNVNVGFAVPIGGVEYPYIKRLHAGQYVDVQLGIGADVLAARGKIMSARVSQSVNASVEGSCSIMCEFNPAE